MPNRPHPIAAVITSIVASLLGAVFIMGTTHQLAVHDHLLTHGFGYMSSLWIAVTVRFLVVSCFIREGN